ncbi:hypothetical protein GTA51_10665 [Desulfovibrio aerotolerans]|uniref:Uncharacterized protein n=1 Tax=Solidesulfovibrio aerotolerans TaxID=295255 RepID=A0A7C9IMG2_9BACT|nr:hypothetical protein [Solidesulfovibrio aerotolerans]MYL83586.1 hypothetical protein [Solidesulfovibrio aerotolerans]
MECSVTIQGLPHFNYVSPAPHPDDACACGPPCRSSIPCRLASQGDGCLLLAAVGPVIEAFSLVVSYEQVLLVLREGRDKAVLEETGQRAAFRLLLLAMRGSGCPFFEQTLAAWNGLGLDTDSYATFQRMVRRLTFAQRADGAGKRLSAVSLARSGHDIEAHLDPILDMARRRCRQDAALNAVILMYSCTRLAVEETRERLALRASAAFPKKQLCFLQTKTRNSYADARKALASRAERDTSAA